MAAREPSRRQDAIDLQFARCAFMVCENGQGHKIPQRRSIQIRLSGG